jgi:hypothetical protein
VNGMQLYEHLVNEHPEALGKIVFTSGDTLSGDLGLFIKGTGRPFLAKPFTPQQLRATVKEALAAQPVAADSKSGECRPKEALAARPVAADSKSGECRPKEALAARPVAADRKP